jgi:TolB-like protein
VLPGDGTRVRRAALPSDPVAAEQASIVVLPFENLSADPDNAFFADGLTEELIAELSGVRTLRVISRTSAMHYKGTTQPLPVIARELNVQHVLEGSVRRAGTSLRITAQLIDATTEAHLWAERYSGTLDDVFDLQERLARRIVEALRIRLTDGEAQQLSARPLADPHAYDAWLRARQELFRWTPDALDRGRRLIDEALSIVGDNALLFAAVSSFCFAAYDSGYRHDDGTLRDAGRFAARALELNPLSSDAHAAAGLAKYKQVGLYAAIGSFRRAVELAPSGIALAFLSFGLAEIGRTGEARGYADEAIRRDPLVPLSHLARAAADVFDGDAAAALARFRDALARLGPDDILLNWWAAQAAAYAGLDAEARPVFARVAAMDAGAFSDMSRMACRALDGDRAGVLEVMDSTDIAAVASTDEWYPNFLATHLAMVGEYEQALFWLEKALAWGLTNHRCQSEHDRFLAQDVDAPGWDAELIHHARLGEVGLGHLVDRCAERRSGRLATRRGIPCAYCSGT